MTNPPHDRREDDKNMQVLANRIDNLSDTIGELKHGVNKINEAISKLALIEDRQSQMFLAFDRSAALTDRWMLRQEAHEKACVVQDKELRALIADAAKDAADQAAKGNTKADERLDDLEEAMGLQKTLSGWMIAGVGTALGAMVMYFVPLILGRDKAGGGGLQQSDPHLRIGRGPTPPSLVSPAGAGAESWLP